LPGFSRKTLQSFLLRVLTLKGGSFKKKSQKSKSYSSLSSHENEDFAALNSLSGVLQALKKILESFSLACQNDVFGA